MYVFHKIYFIGKSPIFVQYSALNQQKYENLKILKFIQNILNFEALF